MKYLWILTVLLIACTAAPGDDINDQGYDPELWYLDQTGWACNGHRWNIWLYYDDFDITNVNAILSDLEGVSIWSKNLPLVDSHYYQDKFVDLTRECRPYNTKYTIYFLYREPESIWLYWNENEH